MSTAEIVLLTLAGAVVSILFLLGLGLLLWVGFKLRTELANLARSNQAVYAETKAAIEKSQGEMLRAIESARSGFATIRGETKAILEEHRVKMQGEIAKINADALQMAAKRSIDACVKLEKSVGLLQAVLLQAGENPGREYGPEDFAPEETSFGTPASQYSVGPTAALDEQAQREEAAQVEAVQS